MKVLVVQYKLVSLEYFMDKLEPYELYSLYDMLDYTDANMKEMSRLIMYIDAQCHSAKKLKPQDIFSLPWDKDTGDETETINKEDLNRLKDFAKEISKN